MSFPVFEPATAADPAWDEAFVRVESYLRAHQIQSRTVLNRLAAEIIRAARERPSTEAPVAAAMAVTRQRICRWFSPPETAAGPPDPRLRQRGRLSLILSNPPTRCLDGFLSGAAAPPGFSVPLAVGAFRPGPELRLRAMPPAPVEFGFRNPQELGLLEKRLGRALRELATWLAILGFLGVAWAAAH